MKALRRLYYRVFPTYVRCELRFVRFDEGNALICDNAERDEAQRWRIAKEEDTNREFGRVYLERRVRVRE